MLYIRKKLKTVFLQEFASTQKNFCKEFNLSKTEAQRIKKRFKKRLDYIQEVRDKFHRKNTENLQFKDFSEFYFWYKRQPRKCFYCGIEEEVLTHIFENAILSTKRRRGKYLEIERKDATLNTYSKENCTLACYFCNNHKSDIISKEDYKKYFSKPVYDYLIKSYNISDREKNSLYISNIDGLSKELQDKYRDFYMKFTRLLDENNIDYKLLQDSKDIWCRDYMPIQINPKLFLTYRYEPDYLQAKKYWNIKSNFEDINQTLNLKKTINTELVLDGGNIVKSKNSVILTDKIFNENLKYSKTEIIEELKTKLQVNKVVIMPWDKKNDYFGHADGMVRFIDENTVLINDYFKNYSSEFKNSFFMALKDNKLKYKELIFDISNRDNDLNWGYINYLEIKNKEGDNIIILPEFGIREDKIAKEQFIKIFKNYKIISINSYDLIKNGGVLNCITWSVYKK